jgi:hypothetical protein
MLVGDAVLASSREGRWVDVARATHNPTEDAPR